MNEMDETKLNLALLDRQGEIVCENDGVNKAELTMIRPYAEGDVITVWTNTWPIFLKLHFDGAVQEARVFLNADRMDFPVPFGEAHNPYPRNAFRTNKPSYIHVEKVEKQIVPYVISENPLDVRGDTMCYPHCTATAETRGESIFAARNTIDGLLQNSSHGEYPYTSWGEDENRNAEIVIDFGRKILAEELDVLLRADFPHDNWWKEADAVFSDGSSLHLMFQKTDKVQKYKFEKREISWVRLKNLRKDPLDPSPFPALTQWRIIGRDI